MVLQQTYRHHAITAEILFAIATAFLFFGEAFYKPYLTPPSVLTRAAGVRSQIALGVLIEFRCVLAIPLIAIVLYAVLQKVSSVLAIGYVAFRLFEAALFANMEIDRLLVLALAEGLSAHPTADVATLEALSQTLTSGEAWAGVSGPIYNIVFVVGMLMLNSMFWKSRLVPRWISAWGINSAVALGGVAVTVLFTSVSDALAIALIAPLAIQEMVLELWFIFKGFNQGALEVLENN